MMGMVRTQVLTHWHLPILSVVGMLLFLAVFLGALAWVYRRRSKEFYAMMQDLPLRDEVAHE